MKATLAIVFIAAQALAGEWSLTWSNSVPHPVGVCKVEYGRLKMWPVINPDLHYANLTIRTNVVTNLVPVSVTCPIINGEALFLTLFQTCETNYAKTTTTNRTASFTFEGKQYEVLLKP